MQKARSPKAHAQPKPAADYPGTVAISSPRAGRIAQLAAMIGSGQRVDRLDNLAAMINTRPATILQRRATGNGNEYGAEALSSSSVIQRNEHPLKDDVGETNVPLMEWLRTFDKGGTLRQLILGNTLAAKAALDLYKKGRETGEADAMLFRSILATIELHKSGATASMMGAGEERALTDEEHELLKIAKLPYDNKDWLAEQYGLSPLEVRSIEAYSLPNKSDVDSTHYMGAGNWGNFADGWAALASALAKLPSLGRLELEVTSYRATREDKESKALGALPPETNIVHGAGTMNMGQKHYMSTALTYSVHSHRAEEVGGMMAITGKSGVLINPFGEQGLLDGGEILYPPDVVSRYEGQNPEGYKGAKTVPVFHMKEVLAPESGQGVVDDKDFAPVRTRDPQLDRTKFDIVSAIEQIVDLHGPQVLNDARSSAHINGGMMYLTLDELLTLKTELDRKVAAKTIMDQFTQ